MTHLITDSFRLALAQLNPVVGDIDGNLKKAREACEAFAGDTNDGGPAVLVGLPWAEGPFVYNAVAYLDHGRIVSVRFKYNLPNYGVFDEKRVFAPGPLPAPVEVRGVLLGVPVCEDIWSE